MNAEYDVAIVGAGPAGATLATLLAQAGHSVLILEKLQLPRYQVGESLLPATVRDLADMLGIRDELNTASLIRKRGATFSWGDKPEELWSLNFEGPLSNVKPFSPTAPSAFNVCRDSFDNLLVNNARKHGVTVLENCTVETFLENSNSQANGRVNGLAYKDKTGQSVEVNARFVADASGQRSRLARQIGKRTLSEFFRKLAVWSYFENAERLAEPLSGNVLFQTVGDCWLWFIPLSNSLTSVGVVTSTDTYTNHDEPAAFLANKIKNCPLIAELLGNADRCETAPYNITRVCSEYSYSYSSFSKPGALVLGDAACFVDVLLSSGVHLATYAAVLAAQSINATISGSVTEKLAMNEYETRLRREYAIFYDGLVGLYDMGLHADDYADWLRKLLKNTSGIAFEPDPIPTNSQYVSNTAKLEMLSGQNLECMRNYNLQQLHYSGEAARINTDLPELHTVLYSDPLQRTWLPTLKNNNIATAALPAISPKSTDPNQADKYL